MRIILMLALVTPIINELAKNIFKFQNVIINKNAIIVAIINT